MAEDQRPACSDVDPDLFFPPHGARTVAARAMRVCQGCPLREPCLQQALRAGEAGVWGGTTETQRRSMPGRRTPLPWDVQERRADIRRLTSAGQSAQEIAIRIDRSARTVVRERSRPVAS